MIHMNIRSMPTNFNSFQTQLNSSTIPYNIICLTETWLRDSNVDVFGMTGFSHEYLVRGEKAGGGTSMFISNKLSYKRREDLNVIKDEYEMLWIEIDKNCINSNSNVILGTIYRTPGTDPSEFITKLAEKIAIIDREKKMYTYRRLQLKPSELFQPSTNLRFCRHKFQPLPISPHTQTNSHHSHNCNTHRQHFHPQLRHQQ